jgi:hypothetical protein
LGERSAAALGALDTDFVKPYLVGPGGLIDDHGHVAGTYGEDLVVLVRPDGYVALIANADDAPAVAGYLRSLLTGEAFSVNRRNLRISWAPAASRPSPPA